jgi:large subunit ribosomal protein L9
MSAGPNGKLYGAVTSQTISDELAKQGFQIERKRIEIPGTHIKNVGKYKAAIKLYENASAEIAINVLGQEIKTESTKSAPSRPQKKRREDHSREDPSQAASPAEVSSPEDNSRQDGNGQPASIPQ